jgi:hypothetical protein
MLGELDFAKRTDDFNLLVDSRPESYKIDPNSIQINQHLGTENRWLARRRIVDPLKRLTMCRLRKLRDEQDFPTLGVVRPFRINKLIIEPTATDWTAAEQDRLKQDDLFQKAPARSLEKIPFDFKYDFHCGDADCKGHTMMCHGLGDGGGLSALAGPVRSGLGSGI